jgi:glycosyltransferase involved in cell wall biosynthesis
MVGVAPKSKRLDRAIDLLEALLAIDSRYQLRVKGKHPLEYNWLLNRPDEQAYYQQLFTRININPLLRYKVIFDPAGDNVNDWFTMVGFILSPSEHESFHMAIGEGMLTGSVPIIWNWEGADEIWPKANVVTSVSSAKQLLLETCHDNPGAVRANGLLIANTEEVLANWRELFAGQLN